ncbi:MAG: ATP-binding protein [Mariniblastus sp.]
MSHTMGSTAQDWIYDNQVPSDPDNCAPIIGMILDQLEKNNWPNKDVFGIHMAMEEAIMNAIKHGNHCAPDKDVHVLVEISATDFYSKVTDQGCGFNPDDVPDPTDDENLEKTCGRGVMLIKNFVDEAIYNEVGNSLELKKKRTS